MDKKNLKVALVHDFLNQYGGAERVLEALGEMFPEAPIYTIIYDKEKMRGSFQNRDIRASFFQKFPKFFRRRIKFFLPLIPTAPETFDLRDFDLVISSSGAWSKGIVTRLNTLHIAYIHSPMRFVWDYNERYLKEEHGDRLGFFLRPLLSYFRLWDKLAADRPDFIIANSKYTQGRIAKYYRKESSVIYPPVNIKNISKNKKNFSEEEKYFLVVSRLSAYKKVDRVIEAFNKLGLPLKIVGTGKEEKKLKSIAGKNIDFLGWVPDEKMPEIFEKARAFIFPCVDDFGIAPVEAMAYGVPIIALRKGGVKETVEEGKTGEFFESDLPEIIAEGVRRFVKNEKNFNQEYIRKAVEKFSKERFKKEMEEAIEKFLKEKE